MSRAVDVVEKRGIEQGMKIVNMLNAKLLKDGRVNDLERSVYGRSYQRQLLDGLFPGWMQGSDRR